MTAENPETQHDIFALCREILEDLLAGKKPEEVQTRLLNEGVPADDVPQLINITVLSAQAASPVIEQRATPVEAVKTLTEQGMEERMAAAMVNMIVNVMTERAEAKVNADRQENGNDAPAASIDEDTMKVLMRLAQAVAVDLQNGGEPETMAAAIRNIEGISDIKEVFDHEMEFIADVRLACQAAERAQAIPLPQALDQFGIRTRPAHVAILVVFFMRLKNAAKESANS